MSCIVPGCEEPYLVPIGGGWDDAQMCRRHLRDEERAAATADRLHELEMDWYRPDLAEARERARIAEENRRREEALASIDRTRWSEPDGSRYGIRAFENIIGILRAEGVEGNRRNALNVAALNLGALVAGGELAEAPVREALTSAGEALGLRQHEIRSTVHYGLRDGGKHPRSAPARDTYRDRQGTRRAA